MSTNKIEYKSKYCEKHVSPAQYLCDRIFENLARKNRKTLPTRYWEVIPYKKLYQRQIIAANSLLKVFSVEAILKALNDKETAWMTSLAIPNLLPFIEKAQKELEKPIVESKIEVGDIMEKPRPQIKKTNILDRLD